MEGIGLSKAHRPRTRGQKVVAAFVATGAIIAITATMVPKSAQAHSFSLALVSGETSGPERLEAAIRGVLLASDERDGHSDETSDGHLGGLDVYLSVFPAPAAGSIAGLKNVAQSGFDIAIELEPGAIGATFAPDPRAVVIGPGTSDGVPQAAMARFARAFQSAYGVAPDSAARAGYNAARRIDLAVRALGGVGDRAALTRALAASEAGLDW